MPRTIIPLAALAILSLLPPAATAEVVGWRTDGTGVYPDAKPPVRWSTTQNVAWSATLPSWSNATPVIVGDKVFVCSEKDTLACIDRATGDVLWQHDNPAQDTLAPDELARLRDQAGDADALMDELGDLQRQINRARRQQRRRNRDNNRNDNNVDLQALEARVAEINAKLGPLTAFSDPQAHDANGYTSPTPVTDGERVFALFGNGVAVCYDLDGTRRWIRFIEKPTARWGQSSSPALVGGRLVLLINKLYGLDAATGEQVWAAPSKQSWGTPVAVEIDGKGLIITPNGEAVDPADGRVLAKDLGYVQYCAPVLHDGVLYFIQNKANAVEVGFADGRLATRNLWDTSIKGSRHYASPVIHDGLIYALSREEKFTVMDAGSGQIVYERDLAGGGGGRGGTNSGYPSVTMAGGYLYLSNEAGRTIVIEPGRSFKRVATNQLERTLRSSPVFVEDRAFIRAGNKLYCIQNPNPVAQAR